ncbi:hypothetical protein ACQ856_05525 [Mycolicibacterium psychrotolerans]|uniref:hypothetical protein n=1 Tax=Mycolicibacterium psychrotolerans TaxID=216929 RepID=UPI003D67C228
MGDHAAAVLGVIGTLGVMAPLSLIGPFIAPGVMIVQVIADTAKYPSTPQTVLQAFIDAPAVFLNTAFNCCSTPLFQLAFGLLNPGPIGYLLSIGPSIAKALQIAPPAESPQPAAASAPKQSVPSLAAPSEAANPAVGQSRRSQPVTGAQQTVAPSGGKRPSASRKSSDSSARKVASDGKGQSARPGNRETR